MKRTLQLALMALFMTSVLNAASAQTVSILSVGTGNYLNLDMSSPSNRNVDGTRIIVYPGVGGPNTKWRLERLSNGSFRIFSDFSGKCIDLNMGDRNNRFQSGIPVVQWSPHGGPNQAWKLVQVSGSEYDYYIESVYSGKVLQAGANGTVQQFDKTSSPNQIWRIQPIE